MTACLLALLVPRSGFGETKFVSNNFLLNTWDTEENLSDGTVTSIIQTPDGYLWVGTYEGLVRFDGMHSVTFDSQNTPALSQSRVQALYLDARGGLWINTYRGGLTLYRNGVFTQAWPDQSTFDFHTTMVTSSANQITFVTQWGQLLQRPLTETGTNWNVVNPPKNSRPLFQCAGRDGNLWFLSREGRVLRIVNGEYAELPADSGLDKKRVLTLAASRDGDVWAGLQNGIAHWDGQHFQDMTPTNLDARANFNPSMIIPTSKGTVWIWADGHLREEIGRRLTNDVTQWRDLLGPAGNRATGAHEDASGGIWFNHYGNGVFYITPDGRIQRIAARNGLPSDRVGAWFQDRDGSIWLGMDRGGLARLSKRRFEVIGPAQGIPACPTLSVCEDNAGTLWIGTAGGGLCAWNDGRMTNYAVGNALSENFVFSIMPQTNGNLWLSAGEGEDLFEFNNGQLQRSPWGVHAVKSLLVDHAGRLWAGTKANVGWYSADARRVFAAADGVAESAVRALVETPDGIVWAGADDGTLYRCETYRVQAFQPKDSFGAHGIWALAADNDGTIWAGTFDGGLLRFKNGSFTRFTQKQGLPMEITQILDDNSGRLWLGTRQGICCVEKSALNALADSKADTVEVIRHLGLPALECSDGYQPGCWRSEDGRLQFSTSKGIVSVDPAELSVNSLPPPVAIEEFLVDGESLSLGEKKIVIPPGREQFQFRFTALSFNAPTQSRFRYRLEKWDNHWVEADTRRVADYAHLPPDHYRFQVIACNSDGVWNRTGASIDFTVQPYFYQTRWFQFLASLTLLSAMVFVVRAIATRKYRQALARLEQQHAVEKDRARIAKDIHDHIGAGLTQIALLSELGRREPEQAGSQLERISDAARDLTRAMDETVWAVDPQRDTLASLMDYISAYAEDYLRAAGIRCRMDFPATFPAKSVDAELRYNLFLALKETLNNVVKHSEASEVWLRLQLHAHSLTLVVEDNGHGFQLRGAKASASADRHLSGLGLDNLKNRLIAVGGRCRMDSKPGKGTRVELTVAISEAPSTVSANESAEPVLD